jgi:L-histidine Nalpha-methyltransferase
VLANLASLGDDVRSALLSRPRRELPARYLYDDLGSALFDAITCLPEYGLTRADARLIERHAAAIAAAAGLPAAVAELGSGSGYKTRPLLREIARRRGHPVSYYPIDISGAALESCRAQQEAQPDIARVHPICDSYLGGLGAVGAALRHPHRGPLLVLFLGSTIGNFSPPEAVSFLRSVRALMEPGDFVLLGADLVKPAARMLAAYDDPTGVTAAFNRNILGHLNRAFEGNFRLPAYRHLARYDSHARRIEMHLRASTRESVCLRSLGLEFTLEPGETIWTESSYKFRLPDLDALAADSGFETRSRWVDAEWPFAECLWRATPPNTQQRR